MCLRSSTFFIKISKKQTQQDTQGHEGPALKEQNVKYFSYVTLFYSILVRFSQLAKNLYVSSKIKLLMLAQNKEFS